LFVGISEHRTYYVKKYENTRMEEKQEETLCSPQCWCRMQKLLKRLGLAESHG